MMDPSIKEFCDGMIVEAIRMYRETGDGAYVFDYALTEIGQRFGLDKSQASQLLDALVDDKLVDPKLLDRVVFIVFGELLQNQDDSQARQLFRHKLEQRKLQRDEAAHKRDGFR